MNWIDNSRKLFSKLKGDLEEIDCNKLEKKISTVSKLDHPTKKYRFVSFENFTNLEKLDFSASTFLDKSVLTAFESLEELDLSGTRFEDYSFASFKIL